MPAELTSNRPLDYTYGAAGRGGPVLRGGAGLPQAAVAVRRSPRSSCTAAGCTCSATCSSSGSSATTSRTASAGSASCSSTSASASVSTYAFALTAPGSRAAAGRRVRRDLRRARGVPAALPAGQGDRPGAASSSSCRCGCRPGWCSGFYFVLQAFYAAGRRADRRRLGGVPGARGRLPARRGGGGRVPRAAAAAARRPAVGPRLPVMRQTRRARAGRPPGRSAR